MEFSISRRGFSYGGIIRGSIRNRLSRVSGDLRQRSVRRRLGDDPTTAIQSRSDAINIAEALLHPLLHQDVNHAVWANLAVRPLAELLYAASKQRNESGIEWTWHALVNVDAD